MDKSKIPEYLNRLKELENSLNEMDEDMDNNEDFDINFLKGINEITEVLSALENETKKPKKDYDLSVNFVKLDENAVTPTYSVEGDAAMDLTVTSIIEDNNETITYGYGISIEIPIGYVGLVFPRSSVRRTPLMLSNCVGVIDSGYRGEIISTFNKVKNSGALYNVGDRAAQIMIIPRPKVKFNQVDELSESKRGMGGFGHTGN